MSSETNIDLDLNWIDLDQLTQVLKITYKTVLYQTVLLTVSKTHSMSSNEYTYTITNTIQKCIEYM